MQPKSTIIAVVWPLDKFQEDYCWWPSEIFWQKEPDEIRVNHRNWTVSVFFDSQQEHYISIHNEECLFWRTFDNVKSNYRHLEGAERNKFVALHNQTNFRVQK